MMTATYWLAIVIGIVVLSAISWASVRRVRRTAPADVEPTPDVEAVTLPVDIESTDSPTAWQGPPAPAPTTAHAEDDGVIWKPNPISAGDPAYFHAVDDLLAKYLPNASLSGAFVFEDHEGRWIASEVYDFDTRTFKLGRAPIPTTETLP